MKTITLDGGSVVFIPEQFEYSKCRGCGADDIIWAVTAKNGKNIPIHWVDGKWIAHWADCPKSSQFRKEKTK